MINQIVCGVIAAAATAVAAFVIIRWLLAFDHRDGRRAYRDGEPLSAGWSQAKRDGWSVAWGEHIQATLGYRGPR